MSRVGTRSLLLAVDGIDYTDAVSSVVLATRQRSGPRLLGEPDYEHGGQRGYQLALTVAQDTAADSLWSLVRTNPSTLVPFYLVPHGNWAASAAEPHYSGQAFLNGPDGTLLGGQAASSRRRVLTVEMVWPVQGEPEEITEGAYPADLPAGW